MRDLLLFLIIFGSVPIILTRPWVGIIMWNWVSFANPHKMTWGLMYDMPVAMIIGVATLIGWLLCKEDRRLQLNAITVLMIMLLGWMAVTTVFSVDPDAAIDKLKQFFKVILMVLIGLTLIKKPQQVNLFVWVAVISIGYFSLKGGVFTAVTGGKFTVWGPPGTFIEDNNALALATLMIIPLMIYLAQTATNRWIRYGLFGLAAISLVSVVGSYSRGGFVGMGAIAVVLWWRSKYKLPIGTVAMIAIVVGVGFIPQKWLDRMDTIQNYEQDLSALGRLEMWGHAIRIGNANPIVGGGYGVFGHGQTYDRHSPEIVVRRNVHSIYFEMLGTQGYVGLIIFLALGIAGLVGAGQIRRLTKGVPGLENEFIFANMIQISLIAYAVSGTFQNLSTYDLYYALLAMIVMQRNLLKEKIENRLVSEEKSDRVGAPVSDSWPLATQRHLPGQSFLRRPAK